MSILPRKLEFGDKFVANLVQSISGACVPSSKVEFPDHNTKIKFLFELSGDEFTRLFSAVLTGADLTYPEQSHEVVWLLLRQLECPVDFCDELTSCLTPFFDAITAQLNSIQQSQAVASQVQAPVPVMVDGCNLAKVYNGCVAVVEEMNAQIMDIYERAEQETPDIVNEMADIIFSAIPVLETLPVDELFELSNWLFENQMENYTGDYTVTWRDNAACLLYCLVIEDCQLDHEKLTAWLTSIQAEFPGNYAAEIFQKFGDATSAGLAQQIGQAINEQRGGMSITEYFDRLIVQFGIGMQTENGGYTACGCSATVEYRLNPLNEDLTVETYGTVLPSDFVEVQSPHSVTLVIGTSRHITHIDIRIASFIPVTYTATINENDYNIPDTFPGSGIDHTIGIDVDETSDTVEIACNTQFLMYSITVTYE